MMTKEFPGPKSILQMNAASPYTKDTATIQCFVKYKKCKGNYLCDLDDNILLDLDCQCGSLPLGYNDKQIVKTMKKGILDIYQLQNISLHLYPSYDLPSFIKDCIVASAAPKDLTKVLFTEGTGTNAVDLAIKVALMYSKKHDSLIGTFQNSIHGNCKSLFTAESVSESSKKTCNPIVPSFGFANLVLPFPQLKYPLEKNLTLNQQEENRCLLEIRKTLEEKRSEKIAAIIVEPIQVNIILTYLLT